MRAGAEPQPRDARGRFAAVEPRDQAARYRARLRASYLSMVLQAMGHPAAVRGEQATPGTLRQQVVTVLRRRGVDVSLLVDEAPLRPAIPRPGSRLVPWLVSALGIAALAGAVWYELLRG